MLSVEGGKKIRTKMGVIVGSLLLWGASDYTVNPSRSSVEALRDLGEYPLDLFNHTGNNFYGFMAGMMVAFSGSNIQKKISEWCGTTETASVARMNRVNAVVGMLGGAALSYAFEKVGGSVDWVDIVFPAAIGAVAGGVYQVERVPGPGDQSPASMLPPSRPEPGQ
jgi:hypothetical protein